LKRTPPHHTHSARAQKFLYYYYAHALPMLIPLRVAPYTRTYVRTYTPSPVHIIGRNSNSKTF